ncbi:MAG: Phosphonate ABC transporter phosphate-binding periplasmic component [Parcubacteria bacterium C7867-007]|nr:MAG: Phosphonate ABC transporter phosphate-binding periplasmic component [Parcubacteria bacterium C7867-007]
MSLPKQAKPSTRSHYLLIGLVTSIFLVFIYIIGFSDVFAVEYNRDGKQGAFDAVSKKVAEVVTPKFNTADYDKRLIANANYASTTSTTTPRLWPAKNAIGVYPKQGAILPYKRIIAYYGNFYSTKMGVLGEYPPDVMIPKLKAEMAKWNAADPSTPTIPAINYIAMTAQESPGKDGMYRFRMPDSEIDKAVALAKQVDGIVILDIQIGLSTLQTEMPLLDKYLMMPNVHLGIDPEFSMKGGEAPGTVIGSVSSADVNFAINHLANLVKEHDLPPKVLVIHRFTNRMVTGSENIKPVPEVQIVMDMDGWGPPAKKLNTYEQFIVKQPVQFTGFKIFYKNDLKPPSTRLLTPAELLKLTPRPLFIQYQ